MLAKSRTAMLSGWLMNFVTSSMGVEQEVHHLRHAGHEHDVLQVRDRALRDDADGVVDDVHQQRHEHGQGDAGVHRHLRDGHEAPDVAGEDEGEQRDQERRELEPVGPDRLQDDALLDEVDGRLGDVLDAGGHQGLLAAAEPHHADGDQRSRST